MTTRSSEQTVKYLKKAMATAALGDECGRLVILLQALKKHVDSDHALCLAMAVFIGAEVAMNDNIKEGDREDILHRMLEMISMTYAEMVTKAREK